ncbi:glycerol-3-phosphate dehydrogenase [NAD(P)+] [Sulfuriferula plumbiphila]|uniref:Glycerol-3-phosphate dehydrogenase [NAD(P)+] n=1 Tax=Sulfuriferula plumbiphila TaxID=171865 RepID=A0A512L897_9PROT|nr:NAD(P)H-dependent glycerol-3-phosphate dehydrogenase [Sulfuriferula plumbiphila]BBP05596.1 glycerol-3-phosphate dehydrogenase [NAD(P)+] [Sulfuriferula plumbiphila]GEP30696.1 glycerol-3-phosphate dehydrogenase [NAD(P)+] [Sulfuriferula plumbiphila]
MNIVILGAGAWGTALAVTLASRHAVTLWARGADQIASMNAARSNPRYLPGVTLPDHLALSADLPGIVAHAELILVATPSGAFRSVLKQLAALNNRVPVIWVCKGFEAGTMKLPHQVAQEELPDYVARGVLSGPSFAQEVAAGLPAALTLAASDTAALREAGAALHGGRLRVYTSNDVIGVELGGALKNVIAIAAGISDGLHFGHNARAALITRSVAEITRLGVALGGRMETFMGLTGMGDLILTCTGDLSRNRQLGLRLAAGESLEAILGALGHIAEGVTTAREVDRLATTLGVDMPITHAVCRVLYEGVQPRTVVEDLLNRDRKAESSQ